MVSSMVLPSNPGSKVMVPPGASFAIALLNVTVPLGKVAGSVSSTELTLMAAALLDTRESRDIGLEALIMPQPQALKVQHNRNIAALITAVKWEE